jgi:hypothetical protein
MKVEIFLTIYDYDCLYVSASKRSLVATALDRVVHLANYGFHASGDLVVVCNNDREARALLRHAEHHCPDTVVKILDALRLANLTP